MPRPAVHRLLSWSTARWLLEAVVASILAGFALERLFPEHGRMLFVMVLVASVGLVLVAAARTTPRSEGAPRHRWLHYLDVLAFNACLLLVLLELASRGLAIVGKNQIAVGGDADEEAIVTSHLLEPGRLISGFPINSAGFFDTEFTTAKDADVVRIVALGDSFAVGAVPYPANYLTLLEALLNARHRDGGKRFEVYNMGVAGASPLEYAHVLRSRGLACHPDLVLVSFFVGNDFTDIVVPDSAPRTLVSRFVAPLVVKRLVKLGAEWFAHPAQHETAEYQIPPRVQLRMTSGGPYDDMYHDLPDIPSFSEGAFLEIELSRLRVCRSPTPAVLQEEIDLALKALDEICAMAPGRVMLAIIPDEFQVNRELLDQLLAARGEKAEEFDLGLPQRLLADFARAHDVPCVDLQPTLLVGEEKLRRVYRLRDTHWNIRGHRIAAFELADAVGRELPRLMKN